MQRRLPRPATLAVMAPGVVYVVALAVAVAAMVSAGCEKTASNHPTATPVDVVGEPSRGGVAPPAFTDITAASRVDFTYHNGSETDSMSIVESLGGGVGIIDFDGDGRLDLFFPGGGGIPIEQPLTARPHGLFRQFEDLRFAEVATSADVHHARHYSHGCTVGDFDSDGFADLLVTGYGGLQLLQNQGDGTFSDVTRQAELTDTAWSSSVAWGDVNKDGNLDLYVAHYVDWSWNNHPACRGHGGRRDICPPRSFRGLDDILYISAGDGTFRDETAAAGLVPEGKGLGVTLADLDRDGDIDIYVANDTVNNFLYRNDGHGRFEEVGVISGLAMDDRGAANGSMGIAVLDYNEDLLADVWVTNYERESFALYRNEGGANFSHVSDTMGIYALGSSNVGFGTVAGDVDRDGDEDIVIANGHVIRYPENGDARQLPLLLIHDGRRFRPAEFSPDQYFGQPHHGRGLALGDIDNDGDLDCVFANSNEPAAVLRNDVAAPGRWLGIRLIGRRSHRDAVGATVVLETDQGSHFRTVAGGGSYLSHNDPRLFFGLPTARPKRLQIDWPSGTRHVVEIADAKADGYIDVIEPSS